MLMFRLLRLIPLLAVSIASVGARSGLGQAEPDGSPPRGRKLPSVQEMIEARRDVWGEAAVQQPNGASFEFFERLLPPVRWVNTDFRHYPIVLSAPRSVTKARWISNGSAVNARANKPPMWYEQGVPVTFFVGGSPERFGEDLARLEGPNYHDGHLPIVAVTYQHKNTTYLQEAFAPVCEATAGLGMALVRFSIPETSREKKGRIEARIDTTSQLRAEGGAVFNEAGKSILAFSPAWRWDANRKALAAELNGSETAELAIHAKPADRGTTISSAIFEQRRQLCINAWDNLLDGGIKLRTPEPIVNDAWRSMVVGTFMIAVGDRLHYSAGNAYAKLYEGECGDTLRSVMLFGHLEAAPAMLKPLLEFDRQATRFHVAGHKLQLLAYFYWLTRDAKTIQEYEPLWRPAVDLILNSREQENGLLPKDNYAGDISTKVYSLNSNANCWRGLRDVAAMLDDMGYDGEAARLRRVADDYRRAILEAVERSERRDTEPPFIPVALLFDEPAHDPLTATRMGSYYDLMCPYIIGSEIFGQGSEREDWLLGYLQNHGGIAMGMPRTKPAQGQFKDEPGINPLYGLRYQLAVLRRDEREKALVGFYGQLAQGTTRGTFIGGEGNRFLHGDADGRSFYLPPNSSSNAAWLVALRYLLVQDWDLDEDGRPESLRLLFAAPRRWLSDGQQLHVENAPTAFGRVSVHVKSNLEAGQVDIHVAPPPLRVEDILLRAPLPEGWKSTSVEIDGTTAPLINGDCVELSGRVKPVTAQFHVRRTGN